MKSTFLLLLLIILPFIVGAQLVAAQTICDGTSGGGTGVLKRTGGLGSTTFTVNAGCVGITLDGCSATSVSFPALSNVAIVINNLACSELTAPGDCVTFALTVTGGSIDINGLTRTISGSTKGYYSMVKFNGAVSGVSDISIKGIVLTFTLGTAASTEYLHVYPVHAVSTIAGDRSAGSAFNVSECTVTSGSNIATSSGYAVLQLVFFAELVSDFETLAVSGNKLEGVAVSSSSQAAELFLVQPRGGFSLTGTASSAIIMRSNSMKGSSIVSGGGIAQLLLFSGPWSSGKNIAGVSSIIVDGADMRDCTVTAGAGQLARFMLLNFFSVSTLTLTNGGKMVINNAWIGGEMTYNNQDFTNGNGAKILQMYSSTATGIKEISANNCLIDMSKNNGLQTSGSNVHAIARVLDFNVALGGLTSIAATNCSIRGRYSSGSFSTVDLYILRAGSTLSANTVSVTDSEVATTAPVIEHGPVQFYGAVSSTNIIVKNLGCGDVMKPTSKCVYFESTITGGSVDIDGLRRTVSGSTAGTYSMVMFNSAVGGVSDISIKGIVLTISSLSTAGDTDVWAVYAASTVAGDSSAGSAFNISEFEITSGSSLTTSSGYTSMWLVYTIGLLGGFDFLEASGNKLEGVALSAASSAQVFVLYPQGGLTLTGTPDAAIIMRSNSVKGSLAVSTNDGRVAGWAQMLLFSGPWESGKNIAGLSSIIVDGADMRDCTATAAGGEQAAERVGRFMLLLFATTSTLTLVHGGNININNAWIGGDMTYGTPHGDGYGAKILNLFSSTVSGIKEISATNCIIDMSKNNGIQATGASVAAIARVLDLDKALSGLISIAASNCSIRGKYSSAASTVDIHVLYAANTLSAATVSISDSEVATATPVIENGPVQFVGAVSSTNIIVKNLGCGDAASPSSICVYFASTITGGSVDIDGMRWTVRGVTAGKYYMIQFNGAVSGVTGISIKRIVLTLDDLSTAGNTGVYLVHAGLTVAGDSSASAAFNVSDCEITPGSSSITASSGVSQLVFWHIMGLASGFETIEASGNKLDGVTLSGGSTTQLFVLYPQGGLTLTGTANSVVILRNNSMRGSSAVSTGSWVQIVLFYAPYESGKNIAGVSSIIIDRADMRDCTVTAASGQTARLFVLFLQETPTLTLTNGGKITINKAWIGGELTYSKTSSRGYGTKILNLFSSTASGIKEITATNCIIGMSQNSGIQASGASVAAIARVLDLDKALSGLTRITASNCSIRGEYSSAASSTEIQILHAASTLASPTAITLTDSTIDASSASAAQQVQAFIAHFHGSVTGGAGGSDTFDVSGSVIRGDYTSSGSYVCVGIAVFDTTSVLLTGFEVIDRSAGVDINAQEASPFGGTYSVDSIIVRCGNNVTTTSTTTTGPPTTTTTSSSTSTTTTSSSATSASTSSEMHLTALTSSSSTSTGAETSTTTTEQPTSTTTTTTTNTTAPNATTNASSREALKTEMEAPPDPVIPVAATVGSTSLSLFAAAGPILTVRALAASASLVGCSTATDRSDAALALNFSSPPPPELGPDSNLFGLRVGDERIATYGGAVTTALIILVSVFICGYIFAFCRARFQDLSMSEAARKCHIPSHMVIALAIVAPPLAQASVVLVSHAYSNLAWLGGIGLVVVVTPVGLLLLLDRHFVQHETLLNLEPEKRARDGGSNGSGTDLRNATSGRSGERRRQPGRTEIEGMTALMTGLVDFLTAPRQEYRKTDTADRMLFFVENHLSVKYAAGDYAAAIVIAAAAGASSCCMTHLCCQLSSYSTAVVAVAWLLVLMIRKPLLVRFDALAIPLSFLIVSVTAILAIVASHSSASSVTEPIQITVNVSFYIGITSLVVAAFANMLPSLLYVYSRCCKSAVWKSMQKRRAQRVKTADRLQKREEREQRRRENGEEDVFSSSSSSSSSSNEEDGQQQTDDSQLDVPLVHSPRSNGATAPAADQRRSKKMVMPAAAPPPSVRPVGKSRPAAAPVAAQVPQSQLRLMPQQQQQRPPHTNLAQMIVGNESRRRTAVAPAEAPATVSAFNNHQEEEGEEMKSMLFSPPHGGRRQMSAPTNKNTQTRPASPPRQQQQHRGHDAAAAAAALSVRSSSPANRHNGRPTTISPSRQGSRSQPSSPQQQQQEPRQQEQQQRATMPHVAQAAPVPAGSPHNSSRLRGSAPVPVPQARSSSPPRPRQSQQTPQLQQPPSSNPASPSRPQQQLQLQQRQQQSPRREHGRRDAAAPVPTSASPPSPKPASPRGPYMQAAIDQGKISDPVLLNKVLDELQEQNPAAMRALRAAVTSGAAAAAAAAAAADKKTPGAKTGTAAATAAGAGTVGHQQHRSASSPKNNETGNKSTSSQRNRWDSGGTSSKRTPAATTPSGGGGGRGAQKNNRSSSSPAQQQQQRSRSASGSPSRRQQHRGGRNDHDDDDDNAATGHRQNRRSTRRFTDI